MAESLPAELLAYYESGKPLVCELDVEPWSCEFWPVGELADFNRDYQVAELAPGYLGFATSGGGEMFALSPTGKIVCLPFIGMSSSEELLVADSWASFEQMLRNAF